MVRGAAAIAKETNAKIQVRRAVQDFESVMIVGVPVLIPTNGLVVGRQRF
jgi:hypothetical protein